MPSWRLFAGRGVLLWCSQGIRAGPCTLGRQSLRGRRRGRRVNRRRSQRNSTTSPVRCRCGQLPDNVPLSNVRNAYIRLCSGGVETHRYQLTQLGDKAGFRMATLYRGRSGGWMIKTNSSAADGARQLDVACDTAWLWTLLQKHL